MMNTDSFTMKYQPFSEVNPGDATPITMQTKTMKRAGAAPGRATWLDTLRTVDVGARCSCAPPLSLAALDACPDVVFFLATITPGFRPGTDGLPSRGRSNVFPAGRHRDRLRARLRLR